MKRVIDRIFGGLGIGFIATNIMMYIFARDLSGAQVINAYILWMFAGAAYGLLSLLYNAKMNKVFVVMIHIILTMSITFFVILIMVKSIFKVDMYVNYWVVGLLSFGIYILIAGGIYLYLRLNVKALNKKLALRKD
ncbi:MAG: DUF3021 family protein [Clostridia bacterium]|nr:DUF3021 family protein [Clostridia bacterium]